MTSRQVRCLVIVCLFLGIGYVTTLASPAAWALWDTRQQAIAIPALPAETSALPRGLGIPLHPQDHATRPPKTTVLEWTITQGMRTPDGVLKRVYLVNDQFPGPTIEARPGDELIVHVTNGLTGEDVSLHWHGLRLQGQNLMDGAVGVTQCPIGPGSNFTYHVHVGDDEQGTFWWHSHVGGQRSDGLFGGIVVHAPGEQPEDDILLMINDWYHASATETQQWFSAYKHNGNEPVPDSLLINGKGRFDCSMAVPARPVQCSAVPDSDLALLASLGDGGTQRRTRWRILNTGSMAGFRLTVPNATLTPLSVDGGHAVRPVSGDGISILYPGERVDVMVSGLTDASRRLYIALDPENLSYQNPTLRPEQSFPITPESANTIQKEAQLDREPFPEATALVHLDDLHAHASTATMAWPAQAQHTLVVYAKVQILTRYANEPLGFMNHTIWRPHKLPLVSQPRSAWQDGLVPFIESDPETESPWVDLVINNLDDGAHPFHMHGHSFYVLSRYQSGHRAGWGSYNPFSNTAPPHGLDMDTPVQKDTVAVPRRGHVVLRFRADNPGIWMLHCHMAVHFGSGLGMALHIGPPGDEPHLAGLLPAAASLCK